MRSKWKDWDYLNIWIFGGVAVGDFIPGIMCIVEGEYTKAFWIIAVCLYAGMAAWLSYRIWDRRFVERFMEKYTVARLPCGANIELGEIVSVRDRSVSRHGIELKTPVECFTVHACRHVVDEGVSACPRLNALLRFAMAERKPLKEAVANKADAGYEDWIDPVVEHMDSECHCVPLLHECFCDYPKSHMVSSPARDGVGDAEAEARNSKDEGDPVKC